MNNAASAPLISTPYNQIVGQKHGQLSRANRWALNTECDPATAQPKKPTARQLRRQLKTIQINVATAGDNIIIPALAGVKLIYELFMWNVAAQDLQWQQGLTAQPNVIPLLPLPGFTATSAVMLGFNGNWEMAHWEIDNNAPLVLTCGVGTQVTGFIRYRVENGSY